jgi:hexulose-6-phosphate isomerase
MQGRLSPPEGGRFQSFPRRSWRQEFPRAREAGLDYIEWIHDEYGRTAKRNGRKMPTMTTMSSDSVTDFLKAPEHLISLLF